MVWRSWAGRNGGGRCFVLGGRGGDGVGRDDDGTGQARRRSGSVRDEVERLLAERGEHLMRAAVALTGDFRWVQPTQANLGALRVTVPAGFAQDHAGGLPVPGM